MHQCEVFSTSKYTFIHLNNKILLLSHSWHLAQNETDITEFALISSTILCKNIFDNFFPT